jgi:hypothetical protein
MREHEMRGVVRGQPRRTTIAGERAERPLAAGAGTTARSSGCSKWLAGDQRRAAALGLALLAVGVVRA